MESQLTFDGHVLHKIKFEVFQGSLTSISKIFQNQNHTSTFYMALKLVIMFPGLSKGTGTFRIL